MVRESKRPKVIAINYCILELEIGVFEEVTEASPKWNELNEASHLAETSSDERNERNV